MDQASLDRLAVKQPSEAIIERIQSDFNMAPLVARTLYEQVRSHFERYYQLRNDTCQLTYLAISSAAPAGRRLEECERVPVKLTLHTVDDLMALKVGVSVMRQARILRMTEEAYEQGGLLSHEDLACLLCTSLATIKRDAQALRAEGYSVLTRGHVKDIGKGVSHKAQIVADYLAGYTFSEIEFRRRHTIRAIQRYCQDFVRIIRLTERGFSPAEIRRTTNLSERLVAEYLQLYQGCDAQNDRLNLLLSDADPATDQPVTIKRGSLNR